MMVGPLRQLQRFVRRPRTRASSVRCDPGRTGLHLWNQWFKFRQSEVREVEHVDLVAEHRRCLTVKMDRQLGPIELARELRRERTRVVLGVPHRGVPLRGRLKVLGPVCEMVTDLEDLAVIADLLSRCLRRSILAGVQPVEHVPSGDEEVERGVLV